MTQPAPAPARRRGRLRAFADALRGWRVLLGQPHARFHLAAALLALALAAWLQLSAWRWAAVLGAIGLVGVAEALNTALECAVDIASPGWHELARDAKDVAAGAVLLASVVAAALGALAFGEPLLHRLGL